MQIYWDLIFSRIIKVYFALYLFAYAAAIFFDYQQSLSTSAGQLLFSMRWHHALWPALLLLMLRFVYSLFYKGLSGQIWQFSIMIPWAGPFR